VSILGAWTTKIVSHYGALAHALYRTLPSCLTPSMNTALLLEESFSSKLWPHYRRFEIYETDWKVTSTMQNIPDYHYGCVVEQEVNMRRDIQHRLRVRSIGKFGFRFSILDYGFPNKTRNPKTDFDEPKSFSKTDFN